LVFERRNTASNAPPRPIAAAPIDSALRPNVLGLAGLCGWGLVMGISFDVAAKTDGRWQGFRFALATQMRPGNNEGYNASRILLASVEDGEYLDRLGDAVDEEVVWMNHCLAGSGQPSGAIDVGMIGQVLGRMHDCGVQPLRGGEVARADIIENAQ
jgi:hypothetical protein